MQTIDIGNQTVQIMTEQDREILLLKTAIKDLQIKQQKQNKKIKQLEAIIKNFGGAATYGLNALSDNLCAIQEVLAEQYDIETRK